VSPKKLEDCREWAGNVVKYCVLSARTPIGRLARSVQTTTQPSPARVRGWCRTVSQALDNLALKDARVLTDDASLIASHYGKAMGEPRSYPYALFLDTDVGDHGGAGLGAPIDLIKDLLHGGLYIPQMNHNPWRSGLWVLMRGGKGSTDAVQMCATFAARCKQKGIRFRAALVAQMAYDDCIRDCPSSTAMTYGNFFKRVAQLREHVLSPTCDDTIGVAYEVTPGRADEVAKLTSIMSLEKIGDTQVKCGDESVPAKTFRVERARVVDQKHEAWSADLGVITVVTDEARAVREILSELVPDVKGPITGKVFDRGHLVTEKGTLTVVHLQLSADRGNMASVEGFRDIYRESSPKLVAVVGIGGSISDKLGLDDVVVANKVIYYDRRKDTADGPIREAEDANVEAAVFDLIQAYQRWYGEQPVHTNDGGKGDPGFKVLIAPIGCGEAKIGVRKTAVS